MSCSCRPSYSIKNDNSTITVPTTTIVDSMLICSKCGTVVEDDTDSLVNPTTYESNQHTKFIQDPLRKTSSNTKEDANERGIFFLKSFLSSLANSLNISSPTIIDRASYILVEAFYMGLFGLGSKGRIGAASSLILSARENGLPLSVERCSTRLPNDVKLMSIYKMMNLITHITTLPSNILLPLNIASLLPVLLDKRIIPILEGCRIPFKREEIRIFSEYLLKIVRKSSYEVGRKQEPLALAILSIATEASSHIIKDKRKKFLKELLSNTTTSLTQRRKEILELITKEAKESTKLSSSSIEWIQPTTVIVLLDDLVRLSTLKVKEEEGVTHHPPSFTLSIKMREKRKNQIERLRTGIDRKEDMLFEEIIIERLLINSIDDESIIECTTLAQLISLEEESLPFLSVLREIN